MKIELDETARRAIFKASPLLMGFLATALDDLQFTENDSACEERREPRDTGTIFDCPADTLWCARNICDAFYNGPAGELCGESACDYEQLGSDLYLESAGHGAGFRDRNHHDDRDESARIGAGLSAAVDSRYLDSYLGDGGQAYFCGGEKSFRTACLPVIFRAQLAGPFKGAVTAVFPTLAYDYHGQQMTCYAHAGQHSGCTLAWYRTTRGANPDEYESLLRELRALYERSTGADDPAYHLVVCKRRTPTHGIELRAQAARYRESVKGESAFVQGRIGESV